MWIERAIDLDFTIHDRKWPKIKVKDSCHCIGNSLCSWLVQQLLKQLQVMKNSLFVPFNEHCSSIPEGLAIGNRQHSDLIWHPLPFSVLHFY